MERKISKKCVDNEIAAYGERWERKLRSFGKKILDRRENSYHKAALKLVVEAKKEMPENVCMTQLSREKERTTNLFKKAMKTSSQSIIWNTKLICTILMEQYILPSYYQISRTKEKRNLFDTNRMLHSTNKDIYIVSHVAN
jgi:hypothetical protein